MHEDEFYYHDHGDGVIHSHSAAEHLHEDASSHAHGHDHPHVHTQTKAVLNRLARAIGHLEHVRKMVEDGQDCTDVLIKDHIEHCVSGADSGDSESLTALNEAIDRFI